MATRSTLLSTKDGCATRRSHSGIPQLQGERGVAFHRAVAVKAVLKAAIFAREVRPIPVDHLDLFEQIVEPGWIAAAPAGMERHACELMERLLHQLQRIGESPTSKDIVDAIDKADSPAWIKGHIEQAFAQFEWPATRTREIAVEKSVKQICRYLSWELRTPIIPEPKVLDIFGEEIEVAPDFLFVEGSRVEAVSIKTRKPNITQSGNKRDESAKNSLEMYALWRYAESVVTPGVACMAVGSVCFLPRADDKSDYFDLSFSPFPPGSSSEMPRKKGFQDGGKNYIRLEHRTCNDGCYVDPPEPAPALPRRKKTPEVGFHTAFKQLMEDYQRGYTCTGKQCEKCDLCRLCNSKRAPLEIKEEREGKSLSGVTLTAEQAKVVYFREGIARVNAGAGAGKTLSLALAVASMMDEGIDPHSILCVTFTNAGAQELRERIALYSEDLGVDPAAVNSVKCTTFNGFGNDIIVEKYDEAGFTEPPTLIDEIERKGIIADLVRKKAIPGLNYEQFDADFPYCKGALTVVQAVFDAVKRGGGALPDEEELKKICKEAELSRCITDDAAYSQMLELFFEYDSALRDQCKIEFSDQEGILLEMLELNPYLFNDMGYSYIIVDEFQDSSALQMRLLKMLVEADPFRCLMVSGDDSQSIFRFRGAVPENIIQFFDKMGVDEADRNEFFLLENHRSTPEIIEFANRVNELNVNRVDKELISTRPSIGKPVVVEGFHDKASEYNFIVDTVKDQLAAGRRPEEIAVFAATRKELMEIASTLSDADIETVVLCPEPMLENSSIQAALALSRFISDPSCTEEIAVYLNALEGGNLLNLPDAVVMDKVQEMQHWVVDEYRSLPAFRRLTAFNDRLTAIDPEERDTVFQEFKGRLDRKHTVRAKQEYCSLFARFGGEGMKRPGHYPGVIISTVHSSKGLEWPVVICSLSKFDTKRLAGADDIEERRRLMFVAATRARDELFLTGQFVAFTRGYDDPSGKRYTVDSHNRYLREAYDILGKAFEPGDRRHALEQGPLTLDRQLGLDASPEELFGD